MIHYGTLLQNATDIITKSEKSLLQNASAFLLQNATVIANCDDFITKYASYYKMRRLLQIATVQTLYRKYIQPMLLLHDIVILFIILLEF